MDPFGRVRHDRPVKPDARHLRLIPQSADATLVRAALRELHELATPEHETAPFPAGSRRGVDRWHPSMGARLTAVR